MAIIIVIIAMRALAILHGKVLVVEVEEQKVSVSQSSVDDLCLPVLDRLKVKFLFFGFWIFVLGAFPSFLEV